MSAQDIFIQNKSIGIVKLVDNLFLFKMMIAEVDDDNDGVITKQEFVRLEKLFHKITKLLE